MDSLQNIMTAYQPPDHPELALIKRFINEQFQAVVELSISNETIIIKVPSAALANTLRLQTSAIQQAGRTTKRLQFRIAA